MKSVAIKINRGNHPPIPPPATGFVYVDQGNYQTLELESGKPFTIYSDSATSCIITLVGAIFAIAMAPLVDLSAQHPLKAAPPSFARMRKALIG